MFRLDDSLFRLRAQVDPWLEFVGTDGRLKDSPERPPQLVVYVPQAREELHDALVELDTVGTVMEPGAAALSRNTRLEVVARHALRKVMVSEQVKEICRKVARGQYRLEDLDRLAERGPGPGVGGLLLVYGTAEPAEVTLKFLTDPKLDETLEAKGVMPELTGFLSGNLGIQVPDPARSEEVRRTLQRLLLLTDFVASIQPDQVPAALERVPIPSEPAHRRAVQALGLRPVIRQPSSGAMRGVRHPGACWIPSTGIWSVNLRPSISIPVVPTMSWSGSSIGRAGSTWKPSG